MESSFHTIIQTFKVAPEETWAERPSVKVGNSLIAHASLAKTKVLYQEPNLPFTTIKALSINPIKLLLWAQV